MKDLKREERLNQPSLEVEDKEFEQQINNLNVDEFVENKKFLIFVKAQNLCKKIWFEIRDFFDRHLLLGYSIKRLLLALITLVIAICVTFILVRSVTADSSFINPTESKMLNSQGYFPGTQGYIDFLNSKLYKFDVHGSIWQQLGVYLRNITPFIKKTVVYDGTYTPAGEVITGDRMTTWFYLGQVSTASFPGAPMGTLVSDLFKKAIPYSFAFGAIATVIAYIVGIPLGIISARYKNKSADNIINGVSVFFLVLPAVITVMIFFYISVYVFGSSALFSSGQLLTKVVPIFVIFLLISPSIILDTRRYVVDEMTADYTKFAISKGLTSKYVFFVHVFRIAGVRIIRLIPASFVGSIFGSSFYTEKRWDIPGMASIMIKALGGERDVYVVTSLVVLMAFVGIITSLVADLIMALMDPRIKLTKD